MLFKLFSILASPLPFPHIHTALTYIFYWSSGDTSELWYSCPRHQHLHLSNHTVPAIFCHNQSCFFMDRN